MNTVIFLYIVVKAAHTIGKPTPSKGLYCMDLTAKEYQKLSEKTAPRSKVLSDCLKAFAIGGGICAFGEWLLLTGKAMDLSTDNASMLVTVTLIGIAAFLTAIGVYDKIAKHAGAGTLVPITGFANSIASAAVEFKTEGLVLGMAAKMFIIAGPVIVYGVVASVVYGLIYWICQMVTGG